MAGKKDAPHLLTADQLAEAEAQKKLNRSLTKAIQLMKTAKEFNKDGDTDMAKNLLRAVKKLLEV